MILGIGIGTFLQFGNHIFHALAAVLVALSGIDGEGSEVVAADVAVKSVPVRIRLGLRLESGLLAVRGEQSVGVILEKRLDVEVAGMFQHAVEQCYVTQIELVVVEFLLSLHGCGKHHWQQVIVNFHFVGLQIDLVGRIVYLICGKKCISQQSLSELEISEVNAFNQTDMNEIPKRKSVCPIIDVGETRIMDLPDHIVKAALAELHQNQPVGNVAKVSVPDGALSDSYVLGGCETMLAKTLHSLIEKNDVNETFLFGTIERVFDFLIGYYYYSYDKQKFKDQLIEMVEYWKRFYPNLSNITERLSSE